MKKNIRYSSLSIILALIFTFFSAFTTVNFQNEVRKGTVERIKVHGKGLEGNLAGDSPDREVSVYLPPSYKTDKKRRYPVVYLLHGFTDDDGKWYGFTQHWINLPNVTDKAFADNKLREVILVTPNAFTRFQGSMYSNSVTTGNWEDFVAKELVSYIDSHYRTISKAASRGLTGHSMGGYGAIRIGQKYPDIFSSIYLLSPCCMMPGMNIPQNPEAMLKTEAIRSQAELEKADFMTKATYASAAAWSPNPAKPPFFLDLPTENGKPQPLVLAKWSANMPLATIHQHIPNLKRLKAIAFDAGAQDAGIAASIRELDKVLNNYNIKHTFEIYEGDHINRIAERIENKVFAFFSDNLSFDQPNSKQK